MQRSWRDVHVRKFWAHGRYRASVFNDPPEDVAEELERNLNTLRTVTTSEMRVRVRRNLGY